METMQGTKNGRHEKNELWGNPEGFRTETWSQPRGSAELRLPS
jgi:hypothetical protein